MFRSILAAVAVVLIGATAQASTYNSFGPQNDVRKSTVLNGGWTVIYAGTYNETQIDLAPIFAQTNSEIMLASALVGSNTFDLLASVASSVFVPLQTSHNQTVQSNGAEWYKNGYSMGFAALGDAISQNSADTGSSNADQRMSWHTNIGEPSRSASQPANSLSYGWRSGTNTSLNGATNWERFILTRSGDVSPVPVPATLPLLLVGVGAMVGLRRRKTANA